MRSQIIIVLILLSLIPFNANSQSNSSDTPYAYLYQWDLSKITQDGVIGSAEYPDTLALTDLKGNNVTELSWAHDGTNLAIGLTVTGVGWVGIGLGALGARMATGNIIMMAYYPNNDTVIIKDMYATGQKDPIIDDDQIIFSNVAGSEKNGITTFEFIIPMKSNDTAGKDHSWEIGGTYGFFSAMRISKTKPKDFTRAHTRHSSSLSVKILDATFAPPHKIKQELTVSLKGNERSLVLSAKLTSDIDVKGLEVSFFQKTFYGKVFLGTNTTDAQGEAVIIIPLETTGEFEFVTVFNGDVTYKRSSGSALFSVAELPQETQEDYGDFRDTIGGRGIRTMMMFMLFFFVSALFYTFSMVGFDLIKIYRIGSKVPKTKLESKLDVETTEEII